MHYCYTTDHSPLPAGARTIANFIPLPLIGVAVSIVFLVVSALSYTYEITTAKEPEK